MTVLGKRVLTLLVISAFISSYPLIIASDELKISPTPSDVSGRVTVDYLVESVKFGNSSYPAENWTQPDKSVSNFLIRGVEVEIDITILQNAGSLGQFSTALVTIEAFHPIGYLEWSDSYTETMTRGMRNTTTVKWTPESAHSELNNGNLIGGYDIRITISTSSIDSDADESNNILQVKMPVAVWRDSLDDDNDFSSYFSMRAYQYSKNTADGPGSVGKGAWQLEEGTGLEGTASYRHSTPGNNYPGNAFDRLVWGFATDGQSGCGEVLGVRSSVEDPYDADGSYFWPWCRAKLDGSQFVSLDISTNAWGTLGAGDMVGLELWRAGAGNTQSLVKEILGISTSDSEWTKVHWKVSDEEMNKLEWHLGFIFESDNSIATSGYHVDDFVIFAVENVSRFTLDVDCKEFGSNEYPDLGFSVIPDDPNPPGMECHVNNNGYRDAQVSVISENNNESWFEPRIDHSLSQTYGSQVFVIIPPDETAIFWINQSIIPSAEVTNPNDITLFNISIIGSFNNEEYYFTSIPVSVGYHDNARIWSDASNPAFYLFPGESSLVDVQVTNTGNKNGKFQLTGAFPNERPQWLPWLSLSFKDQFGNDLPKDNNGFQSIELTKGQSADLSLELTAPLETYPGEFSLELQVNGIEGTSTQATYPLSVEVRTKFDLLMNTENQNISSPADGVQELIPVTLINNGNTEEIFNFELLGERYLLGATLSSDQSQPLSAYGLDSSGVNIILPMTEGITPGDYTLILTATSIKDQTFKEELYFVITIEGTRKVEVESRDLTEQSYRGGQSPESINIQINNTGNTEDKFEIELEKILGMNAYIDTIGMDGVITPLIQPGSSFNVTISFTFDTLAEGDFNLGITARSAFNENVISTGKIKFYVGSVGRLELLLNSEDLEIDLSAEESGKSYILRVDDDGDYDFNIQIFNRFYEDQDVRIDFDDQVSSSYFRIKIDEYTTAFNIEENNNDKVALKITVPKSTLLSLPSDSYQVNLTIWVESDYDVVPLVLKVELMRESLVDKQGEDNSSDLSNKIFNGISIVLLIGILGVLLLIFWREYSKNDEEDLDKNLSPGVNYLETETTTSTLQNNISSELSYEDLTQHLPQPDLSGAPPVPETGLPDGWTFEQWQHYGQQWLNQQK
tara:strand:+ start:451 stop:3861 length:3411 start_codon:yes stop_codon:yes gene_type:complete